MAGPGGRSTSVPSAGEQIMPQRTPFAVRELDRDDIAMFRELLSVMGRAFDDPDTYTGAQPDAAYLRKLLAGAYFIALAAVEDGVVIGGLAAYELPKFERARSEIYIYELAVASAHRRRGVENALNDKTGGIGAARRPHGTLLQASPPGPP